MKLELLAHGHGIMGCYGVRGKGRGHDEMKEGNKESTCTEGKVKVRRKDNQNIPKVRVGRGTEKHGRA